MPHIFKVWNLTIFDISHYYNQENEHIYYPPSLLAPFVIPASWTTLLSSINRQPLTSSLLLYISLHFLEFYVNEIIQYVIFYYRASFTQHNYIKIDLLCISGYSSCLFIDGLYTTMSLSTHLLISIFIVSSLGL